MQKNPIELRKAEKGLLEGTARNGGIGILIGSAMLTLRFNRSRRSPEEWDKFKKEWTSYFLQYPVFLTTFTVLFKGLTRLGREFAGYRGLTREGHRKFTRRVIVSSGAFLSAFCAQRVAPIFNWTWALYAFLRSFLGLLRLYIPDDLQPEAAEVYGLIHATLPVFVWSVDFALAHHNAVLLLCKATTSCISHVRIYRFSKQQLASERIATKRTSAIITSDYRHAMISCTSQSIAVMFRHYYRITKCTFSETACFI